MRLEKCKVIEGVSLEKFKSLIPDLKKEFSQYLFEKKEPFNFWETEDNPSPKDWRDEEILIAREADYGCSLHLNKCNHQNFDFDIFLYQGKILIIDSVYYYGCYVADLIIHRITNNKSGTLPSYREWADAHKDPAHLKWAKHNFKIDQEDLAKIGIEV